MTQYRALVIIIAILAITIIEVTALSFGYDGTSVSAATAVIAGLTGFMVSKILKQ